MEPMLAEKEVVIGVARYLLGNAARVDEFSVLTHSSSKSNLPGASIQTLVQPTSKPGKDGSTAGVPAVVVHQIVKDITGEDGHECQCLVCDPDGQEARDTKVNLEVEKRMGMLRNQMR